MKYLCLIYHDEDSPVPTMTEAELETIAVEVREVVGDMKARGSHIVAAPLQPDSSTSNFRVTRDGVAVTDGPYIETKEHLAGFYLIEARDLNDAIRIMSKTPSTRFGTIEVRPVQESLYMAPDCESP